MGDFKPITIETQQQLDDLIKDRLKRERRATEKRMSKEILRRMIKIIATIQDVCWELNEIAND